MRDCTHCRHQFSTSLGECPECGAEWRDAPVTAEVSSARGPAHQPYAPIARFANVAEAGYFHCELEGQLDCEVRLTMQNHFDAPSASWWSNYVLTVPATEAERATDLLKQIVGECDSSDFPEHAAAAAMQSETQDDGLGRDDGLTLAESRIHWTPIILTLTAGTFVIWAAKQAQRPPREPAAGKPDLVDVWDRLGDHGSPWVQTLGDGRGRRELVIDRVRRFAILREDSDGDGIFERKSQLPLTPTVQ